MPCRKYPTVCLLSFSCCKHLASSRLGQRLALGRPYQTRENQKHHLPSLLQVERDVRLPTASWHLAPAQHAAPNQPASLPTTEPTFPGRKSSFRTRERIPTVISLPRQVPTKPPCCHLACPARPDTQSPSKHRCRIFKVTSVSGHTCSNCLLPNVCYYPPHRQRTRGGRKGFPGRWKP